MNTEESGSKVSTEAISLEELEQRQRAVHERLKQEVQESRQGNAPVKVRTYLAECYHHYSGDFDVYERGTYLTFEDAVASMPIPAELYQSDDWSDVFRYVVWDKKDRYEFIIDGSDDSWELPDFILKAVERHRAINA